jgi:hypothetical protein
MSISITSKTSKLVGGLLGISMAVSFVFGGAVVPAQAATAEELQAQINSLLATISSLQGQLSTVSGGTTATPAAGYVFSRNLKQGDTGADVMNLQKVLNMSAATQVSASGAGSPGMETSTFGPATKAAVIKFQNMYASEVLAPVGLTTGTGFVGAATRAKLNTMGGSVVVTPPVVTPPGTTPPAQTGTGLTVSSPVQPAANIAPANAARVPFAKVTLTAGMDGDVRVNGIVVERGGPSSNSDISGVVLLDEAGVQLGIAKTLNSNNQAVLSEPVIVKAGQSRTLTIAANMGSGAGAGNVAVLSIVGINTTATVTGSLPIVGGAQTINGALTIGTATLQRGGTDPGANQSKEIGTTGYTFSSVRLTAGSAEKIILKSVRWNQTGSSGSGDIANLKTFVDGTAYDVVASADGKYFVSTFGTGLVIDKGFSKDLSIKGDIVSGSGRTIEFNIAKRTDIGVVGETFGFGISPTASGVSCPTVANFCTTEDPWYDGATVTVNSGSMTVSSDTAVAAQNIAVNVSNQPLGGFQVEVRGEPISIARLVFNVTTAGANVTTSGVANITSATLVDQNGAVVAGPVDIAGSLTSGTLTFTDTVTLPVGITKLSLKAKIGTAFGTNSTVQASTTPSTGWTSVTGQTTGNSITPAPTTAVTGSLMTVKAGALSISVSSQPTSRSVIAGSQGFEFARYIFDASQSGEDIRITSIPLLLAVTGSVAANNLTSCQLFDGATVVTSGSNLVNPTAAGDNTFTFDGTGLIIAKGTSKTLSLKCNLSTAATSGTAKWGLTNNAGTYTAASGQTSGQTVAETMNASAGSTMTAATGGSYSVSQDTSITYKVAQAGANGVTLGAFQFSAGTNEDVMLRQIALALTNGNPSDFVDQQVTLWNGATQVGIAQFGLSIGTSATSTLVGNGVLLPSSGNSVTITVKGNLLAQTAVEGTPGTFVTVAYDGDNNGLNGNYAVGASSGSTIAGSSADISTAGLRVFRTVPTIAVTSNGGSLVAGGDLYKFTVTNPNSRDLVIAKVSFSVTTSGGSATNYTLYADGVAANASAASTTAGLLTINFDGTSSTTIARIIPANGSKTYVLRAATLTPGSGTDQLSIALLSDTAYPTLSGARGSVDEINTSGATTKYFIWTPYSTSTLPVNTAAYEDNADWTNSYGLPGFPAVGQSFPVQTWSVTH